MEVSNKRYKEKNLRRRGEHSNKADVVGGQIPSAKHNTRVPDNWQVSSEHATMVGRTTAPHTVASAAPYLPKTEERTELFERTEEQVMNERNTNRREREREVSVNET